MREILNLRWAFLAGALGTLFACTAASQSMQSGQDSAQIERGRYLTIAADCAACHDDPYENRPFAGGRPIETPFGRVVAPNITPDRDTGIGAWDDAQFDAVLRRGRLPDGRRVYPAMPFPYFTKMSRDDVLSIRAYLNTVAPVHNPIKADQLPFPFSIRAGMSLWDALYFKTGDFRDDPARSALWNRGAYLVEGPGHCGACHTPKSLLGGDKSDEALRGYAIQGWFAPDLTGNTSRGLTAWSANDVVEYLKTGHNRLAGASGPMAKEVADSSSRMSVADLQAIATYLKDLGGAQPHIVPVAPHDSRMTAGAAIYGDLCSACHKADGSGVPYLIPNLAASGSVASRDPTSMIRVVLEGAQSVATSEEPTAPAMPAFGWQLTDVQVAAVLTYIGNSWNHAAAPVTESSVSKARSNLTSKNN